MELDERLQTIKTILERVLKGIDPNDRHHTDVLNNMWLRNETLIAKFNAQDTLNLLEFAISYAKRKDEHLEAMLEIAEIAAGIVKDVTPWRR